MPHPPIDPLPLTQDNAPFSEVTPARNTISRTAHGWRAKCLQRLIRLDLPVPQSVALPATTVRAIAAGHMIDSAQLLKFFGDEPLVSVRPSPENPDWGGPATLLNVGWNETRHNMLVNRHGQLAADTVALRFIKAYATHVARLDPDMFTRQDPNEASIRQMLNIYQNEMEVPFPEDAAQQLSDVLRSMARAWEGTSARLLRQAKGAPEEAPLGLVVQKMALGVGEGRGGSGIIRFIDPQDGMPLISGRYLEQGQGNEVQQEARAIYLAKDKRGHSLEDISPEAVANLKRYGAICREKLREEMQIEFTVEDGNLAVLDAVRVRRSARAELRVAVDLADDGIITQQEAVLRVSPQMLPEMLHPQIAPDGQRKLLASGIGASPGAAVGRIVFSSSAAQTSAARGEPCILVRRETAPEDVRGMHSAVGVLTQRGGMTSHAAVIARGIGLPCVVGAELSINQREKWLEVHGQRFHEGDQITLDGSSGKIFAGSADMIHANLDTHFQKLLGWADEIRDIGVRANADTPADAATARHFKAEGIGLCRTEYMFFEEDRLVVMREMIFADRPEDRAAALARLAPMQQADFVQLFEIMQGLPVCIRLFDPPLHEFLPQTREGIRELAEALDKPFSDVMRRTEALTEFNPMLGMRGVRLGVALPEIYDMQARAIFNATVDVIRRGALIVPEVMIPLVSAVREVEIVKARIDAIAAAVKTRSGVDFTYRLGVMVETPRAALRAGEIAQYADFLSFGTNDLTQMTYGMSRDDAGRFMNTYVRQQVFAEDPFHVLDIEGVGELLEIGAMRSRQSQPNMTLSICGEHGGNPESIAFFRKVGFNYVSCSPYRVPQARLAAAHLAISDPLNVQK